MICAHTYDNYFSYRNTTYEIQYLKLKTQLDSLRRSSGQSPIAPNADGYYAIATPGVTKYV